MEESQSHTSTMTLSLSNQEKQELKKLALNHNLSATELVRRWIKQEKERQESEK